MRRRPLQCPFCDNYLASPADIRIRSLDITGGICTCGAVYVLDRKGHNLGEIYLDALTFLCKGDFDKAVTLVPEQYEEEIIDYDIHSNTISRRESKTGRLGKIIFMRLRDL